MKALLEQLLAQKKPDENKQNVDESKSDDDQSEGKSDDDQSEGAPPPTRQQARDAANRRRRRRSVAGLDLAGFAAAEREQSGTGTILATRKPTAYPTLTSLAPSAVRHFHRKWVEYLAATSQNPQRAAPPLHHDAGRVRHVARGRPTAPRGRGPVELAVDAAGAHQR